MDNYNNNPVKKPFQNKPQRYSEDTLTKSLEGRKVEVTFIDENVPESGILKTVGVYDIHVITDRGAIIIMKSAIRMIRVLQ